MVEWKWMDKAIDLHRKHGLREIDLSQLRQMDKKDALSAAEFVYKDMMENSHLYPEYKELLYELEHFNINDKPKAVGLIFEITETCGKECNIPTLRKMSKDWSLSENQLHTVLKSLFK